MEDHKEERISPQRVLELLEEHVTEEIKSLAKKDTFTRYRNSPEYKQHCKAHDVPFQVMATVTPEELFYFVEDVCSAGFQEFILFAKKEFNLENPKWIAHIHEMEKACGSPGKFWQLFRDAYFMFFDDVSPSQLNLPHAKRQVVLNLYRRVYGTIPPPELKFKGLQRK